MRLNGRANSWHFRVSTSIVLMTLMSSLSCQGSRDIADAASESPSPAVTQPNEIQDVSLVQLIASPEKMEGRLVRVQGFCRFEFEEQAIYLHREDADQMNFANGLWLDTDRDYADRNATFVVVEGTFTTKSRGHLGAWPGAIRDITRLERSKSRADYERLRQSPKAGPRTRP